MIEVEIRSRLESFEDIKLKIKKLGAKFIREEEQEDIIFGHENFLDSNSMVVEGGFIARIRTIANKASLEFKEISRTSGGVEISSIISDKSHASLLLDKLGFKESFTVSKRREFFYYKDFTICLDEVKDLGRFIEIEKEVSEESEKEKAKGECFSLLKEIDKSLNIENRKYGDMMQERKNARKSDT